MLLPPNTAAISSLPGAPRGLAGALHWRLVAETDGTVVIAESSDGIVEVDLGGGHGARRRYDRAYTTPNPTGPTRYRAIWRYGYQELPLAVVVANDSAAAFATADDVALRLGRTLTAGEASSVTYLLRMAAAVIADAASKDDGWVVTLDPVPQLLRGLSVELTVRALANPNQLDRLSEQLGNYSMTATFNPQRLGLELTDTEQLIVRRTVYGRTTASAPVHSAYTRAQRILTWDHMLPAQQID